jgi:hypothetical protein
LQEITHKLTGVLIQEGVMPFIELLILIEVKGQHSCKIEKEFQVCEGLYLNYRGLEFNNYGCCGSLFPC